MAVILRTPSAFDPLALHDNATGRGLHPATLQDAVATVSALIFAGHSLDLGLGQTDCRLNFGGGNSALTRLIDQAPIMTTTMGVARVMAVALYVAGPRQDELAVLEGSRQPASSHRRRFARVVRHRAFRPAIAHEAVPLAISMQ